MLRKDYCFDYLNASFYQYVSLLENAVVGTYMLNVSIMIPLSQDFVLIWIKSSQDLEFSITAPKYYLSGVELFACSITV